MGYTKNVLSKFFADKKPIKSGVFACMLLFISTIPLTTVYADNEIDLTLEQSSGFQQGVSYPIEDSLSLEIYVKNLDQNIGLTSIKWIDWKFCEGNMSVSGCDENNLIDSGSKATTNIGSNSAKLISLGSFQATAYGNYTLDAQFRENDVNPTNDQIKIVITVVDEFTDFEIDLNYKIIPQNDITINTYNGVKILNSNKNYDVFLNGTVENWKQNQDSQIGWQLINNGIVFAEEMKLTSEFPSDIIGKTTISVNIGPLNSPLEGDFTLKYGLFVLGVDMNPMNNLKSIPVYFDDSLDISISPPESTINPEENMWYAGQNTVKVEVENKGNLSVENFILTLEQIYEGQYTDILQSCKEIDLHPGEKINCYFDLLNPGNTNLILNINTAYANFNDEDTSDNQLSIPVQIIAGELNASVIIEREDAIFTFDDTINLIGVANSLAPSPLSFEWSKNGWTLANGDNVNLSAKNLGIGTHNMSLILTDALDRTIFIDFEIVIVNTTFFSYANNMIHGVAPTRSSARVDVSLELVPELKSYPIDEMLSPLYLLDIEVVNTLYPNKSPGLERLEMNIDLEKLLPPGMNLSESLNIYTVNNDTFTKLETDNAYFDSQDELYKIYSDSAGLFLIAAEIESVNISIEGLHVTPYKSGGMILTWNVSGEITNPFIYEWNIFRISNSEELLIPFDSLDSNSNEDWAEITKGKLSDSFRVDKSLSLTSSELEISLQCVNKLDEDNPNYNSDFEECNNLGFDQRWYDPNPLEADMCASYLIVASDREGRLLWNNGAVSGIDELGKGSIVCGDNKAPLIQLGNLQEEIIYDNSSSCLEENLDYSRCYSVKLKWNWPMIISESVDFKLYRTEQYVTNLQFAIPLMTYENIIPGENIEYIDTGKNIIMNYSDGEFENLEIDIGIRPNRVYYYYLSPIDALGNERTVPIQGNWLEVKVDEVDVAEYHPEWIPPEPTPPETITGTDFEIELLEFLDESSFQLAGIVTIIIICLNLILIPYSLQLRKRTSKKIDYMIKTGVWGSYDDDEDY